MDNEDIFYMKKALLEAQKAYEDDEVPVGAVVLYNGKIIGRGYNQVEKLQDATAHAEMIALTAASQYTENWRLLGAVLYTTLEPCIMCAGALMECRVERIVWGAPDLRLGANGSFVDVFAKKHPMHQIKLTGRILEEESASLLRSFFQKKRNCKRSKEADNSLKKGAF